MSEDKTLCKRCKKYEDSELVEQCFWCENELCNDCWEEFGNCGCNDQCAIILKTLDKGITMGMYEDNVRILKSIEGIKVGDIEVVSKASLTKQQLSKKINSLDNLRIKLSDKIRKTDNEIKKNKFEVKDWKDEIKRLEKFNGRTSDLKKAEKRVNDAKNLLKKLNKERKDFKKEADVLLREKDQLINQKSKLQKKILCPH